MKNFLKIAWISQGGELWHPLPIWIVEVMLSTIPIISRPFWYSRNFLLRQFLPSDLLSPIHKFICIQLHTYNIHIRFHLYIYTFIELIYIVYDMDMYDMSHLSTKFRFVDVYIFSFATAV